MENFPTKRRNAREERIAFSTLKAPPNLAILLAALSLSLCVLPAQAQEAQKDPQKDPQERNANTLNQRVDSLQSQVERLSKDIGSLGEMAKQPAAEASQDSARNPARHPAWLAFVAELQERMRVMERALSDLTERIEQMEYRGTQTNARRDLSNKDKRKGSADERFAAAQELLRARKVEEAVRAFGDFARDHPNDSRVAETLFYLGESYTVLQDDKSAMQSFLKGYKNDRNGAFAPRLLLRLGQTLAKMDKREQSCRVLHEFRKRFSKHNADMTKLAESELVANSCSGS